MEISDSYIAETKYKVSTATHSINFAQASDAAYDAFASVVKALNVGVLGEFLFQISVETLLTMHPVNNVGKSHAMPVYLVDTPLDEIRDIVSINVNATLRVTYAILPGMIQR